MPYDTIIHNGIIVTVNSDFDIIDRGWLAVLEGRIECIGKEKTGCPLEDARETIDANGGLIIPGMVNLHTHLPMTLFRGIADDLPLSTWLNEYIFPAEKKFINPLSVRMGTLLGCAELLLSGTTTFCDGYFYENEVAAAAAYIGIRGVVGQGVVDFPAPGVPEPSRNIEYAEKFVDHWLDNYPRIYPSIFCHAPYTCSNETLEKAKAIAREKDVLFQIHVAETEGEVKTLLSDQGVTPVGLLDQLGILDERTLAVHSVWINPDDIARLKAHDTPIAHCPESNMKLAAGIAPIAECLKAGITVGLGTDGCASNNNLDIFGEMDSAAKLHKIAAKDPTVLDASTVVKMATINGAKAIGLDPHIGSLEPGKQADLVVVDISGPHWFPMYHPASQLVYVMSGADVRDVMVDGEWLVKNCVLQSIDLPSLVAEIAPFIRRIQNG